MKGCVFSDARSLYRKIEKNNYNMQTLLKYKNKYIDVQDGTSTKKIVDLVMRCMNE